MVVDLDTIPLIETGQFDNVQSDRKLSNFVRDHLLEPDGSKKTLKVYRNDIGVSSSAQRKGSVRKGPRKPRITEWDDST